MILRRPTTASILLGVLLSLPIAGCGDDKPRRYPVSGRVTYNGEPLAKGTITFSPQTPDQGVGSFGQIRDGSYRMTTFTTNDGAVPSRYNVAIAAAEFELSNPLDDVELSPTPEASVARDIQAAKHLIPPKYGNAATSDLTAVVEARSNTIDFPLTD